MKKLLLITRHAIPNYGSFLQTYSSIKIFEELGFDVEVLDYVPELETPKNLYIPMLHGSRFSNNKIKKFIYTLIRKPDFWMMGNAFREFQKAELHLTREYNNLTNFESSLLDYDLFVTGSDQVWGPIALNEFDVNYFWENFPVDKNFISFSASFGKLKFTDDTKLIYKKLLRRFDYLLVREDSAVDLLNELGYYNCQQILDPTLMMSSDFWNSYIEDENINSSNYILVYQVHDNPSMDRYVKELQRKTGKKVIRLSNSFAHVIRIGKLVYLPSPKQFLSYIKNADYVVTNSFHATVFSLIFHKQFIVIDSGETNTRIASLLRLVKQDKRQISSFNDFSQLDMQIKYDEVDMYLNMERKNSMSKIKQLLNDTGDKKDEENC